MTNKIRRALYKIYWRIESVIMPGLKYSQDIYEQILKRELSKDCTWVDLGCGHQLLPDWREEEERRIINEIPRVIIGLDYDILSLRKHKTIERLVRGNLEFLPFKDNGFDFVTSNMVFEHLEKPDFVLSEIRRILAPGGKLLFHTPNYKSYATVISRLLPEWLKDIIIRVLGRNPEDVFPTYYKINEIKQIEELSARNGFAIKKIKMIVSTPQSAMITPIAIIELLVIKLLMKKKYKEYRNNIIVLLEKTAGDHKQATL